MKTCDECGGKHYAKGFCKLHYRMPSQINPKPIKSNKPLQSTKTINPIPKQSDKEKKRQGLYTAVRKVYLLSHPNCEAQLEGCTLKATEIHHQKGRIGDLLNNMNFFIALCHSCHEWCEQHPKQAKELGFSLNRLDK